MGLYREFIRGLIENPRGVSAPTPSSAPLAAAIAAKVNPFVPGLVVELGAGTGAVTAALLARGVSPDRLMAFESSPAFCRLLTARFPGVWVVCGDAFAFDTHLSDDDRVAAVVSGLPLLHFTPARRRELIRRSLDRQGVHGRFIQLSYGWRPATPPGSDFLIGGQMVWRNFPPAHVWTYTKAPQRAAAPPRKLAASLSVPA